MIYFISKKLEISAAHKLTLSYESKCSTLHGHNWEIELFFVGRELNPDGMVIDFTHIKKQFTARWTMPISTKCSTSTPPPRTSEDGW